MENPNISLKWDIVVDIKRHAIDNMDIDSELYEQCKKPTLRIFGWISPSITAGYSVDVEKEIDLEKARDIGVEVAKRPTGGGIAFHTTEDVSYTVVAPIDSLPKSMKGSYIYISELIADALCSIGIDASIAKNGLKPKTKAPNICFLDALDHEITAGGRKLVGSAQKRGRYNLIQQGTIAVKDIDNAMTGLLKRSFDPEKYRISSVCLEALGFRSLSYPELSTAIRAVFS